MTLEGPRVLSKVLTGSTVTNDGSALIASVTGQWDQVVGSDNAAVQRTYFDLSGYNMDFLTTFVQGVEIQDPGPLAGTDNANELLEILSTEFISDAEIVAFIAGVGFNGPGYSQSTMNMDQVVYGRRRSYTQDGAITPIIPNLHHTAMWGTANALTSDKLHITRILLTTTIDSVTFVSDTNVVMGAIISKEKELPFLMRQKRSYELATGP
jgi:hypothetical protein